ncbi:PorV/PorQ family protein [Gemmatimonas sp.]|uniref:PorV/PorQ family protein n=1 Tax=Gemmatimonas sp. TaxID=1962908 RepID=UPI002ED96142
MWCAVLLLPWLVSAKASAQASGALFLLTPLGARAVAQGDAVAADTVMGTEAMWWNPALLARLPKREIAVHHSTSFASNNDMVALAMPSKVLGTLAVSGLIVDYGSSDATDANGFPLGGQVGVYNYQLAASYASPVGRRLSAGVTYKYIVFRRACSGNCGDNAENFSGKSSAVDLGVHYVLPTRLPVSIGASLRNVGPGLQVRDAEQADPLPRTLQVGARVDIPIAALKRNNAALEASADVFSSDSKITTGMGLSLGYRKMAFLHAGYRGQLELGGGPSIGFGFRQGAFGLDVARRFEQFSSGFSQPPTYVMIRARF